jgi:outer membrane protein OmpA-like peptidoglycan-associated protein
MRASLVFVIVAAMAFAGTAASAPDPRYLAEAEQDAPKAADHPVTGRYEGAFILGQTVKAFDELTLPAGPAEGKYYDNKKKFTKTQTAQGKVTRTAYISPVGRSSLEVFRNYRSAVAAKGFEPVFECAGDACGPSFFFLIYRWDKPATKPVAQTYSGIRGHLLNAFVDQVIDVRYALFRKQGAGGDDWVAIYAGLNRGGGFGSFSEIMNDRVGVLVQVVEAGGMEEKMVTLKAEEITSDIAKDGRAVFYGIQFDFDKADIKPESEPQLVEMAKALKAEPKLKVFIVGHTDNQGKLDYNTGLSQRRAEAVVKALSTKHAIPAARMMAKGLASLAPVATNRTEDGRAKNRRVEMVEQ